MMSRTIRAGLLVCSLSAAVAWSVGRSSTPDAEKGPRLSRFGPVFDVPEPDFATPLDRDFKAVFDVARAPSETDRVNPSIETLARFLNVHARAGVADERLHVALVLHGSAGKSALSHAAYRARFGTDNPNLALLEDLAAANVRVVLCGQTAASRGFERDELAKPVEIALSAMTALITLQQDGYALIAF